MDLPSTWKGEAIEGQPQSARCWSSGDDDGSPGDWRRGGQARTGGIISYFLHDEVVHSVAEYDVARLAVLDRPGRDDGLNEVLEYRQDRGRHGKVVLDHFQRVPVHAGVRPR